MEKFNTFHQPLYYKVLSFIIQLNTVMKEHTRIKKWIEEKSMTFIFKKS